MLHELLLALSGYPGSIFIATDDDKIEIVSDLPFVNPSEVDQLRRLCKLASHYHYYRNFIAKYGHTPGKAGEVSWPRGLYLTAVCQGLDGVLGPYRETLLQLESQILADPYLTPAAIHSQLQQYQILFPALTQTLEEIIQHQAHGCYILEVVHKAAVNGIPVVTQALHRILYVCHGVMYKQLAAWMLHGLLLDKYSEFFIHQHTSRPHIRPVQVEDDDLGLGGVTGRQMAKVMQISDGTESSRIDQYSISADKLPSYIPTRVANKILFVGESVQMFESGSNSSGMKQNSKGAILQGKEDAFSRDIHQLSQQETFQLMSFEATVDKIRSFVAEQLWRLIVEESDLVGHLRILKDFYLLGRGELYLAFIDQAHPLLRTIPKGITEHDVNAAFQHAARDVLYNDETLLQRFRLSLTTSDKQQTHGKSEVAETGWNCLRLHYKVQWPLHILFTPSVSDRYNRILHFLLHVKRVQLELQQCWALQMQRKHLATLGDRSAIQWWLRNHMAFLVDNLQYYLQVDVIESLFSVLLNKIQSTPDFEEIRLAHDTFLTSLLSQSFLLTKPIAYCLKEILQLCHRFSGLMTECGGETLTEDQDRALKQLNQEFQRQSSLLFTYLSSVRSHQSSPHLAQLLLRIDYNKYFTVSGGQLGSYQVMGGDGSNVPSSRRN